MTGWETDQLKRIIEPTFSPSATQFTRGSPPPGRHSRHDHQAPPRDRRQESDPPDSTSHASTATEASAVAKATSCPAQVLAERQRHTLHKWTQRSKRCREESARRCRKEPQRDTRRAPKRTAHGKSAGIALHTTTVWLLSRNILQCSAYIHTRAELALRASSAVCTHKDSVKFGVSTSSFVALPSVTMLAMSTEMMSIDRTLPTTTDNIFVKSISVFSGRKADPMSDVCCVRRR